MAILLCSTFICHAQEEDDEDSVEVKKPKIKEPTFTYYRIGLDVSKLVASVAQKNYKVVEAQLDTRYKRDLFFALELGTGNSVVENEYITYKSSNSFARVGLDKTFFRADFKQDMDNAFIGLRYGIAAIKRSASTYNIYDAVWGNTSGTIDGANFVAHWLEINAGFRLEIVKNIFAGWNIRAKTFINPRKFEKLPPAYVAGYGRGDKNTAFGYNFYILYGFGKR